MAVPSPLTNIAVKPKHLLSFVSRVATAGETDCWPWLGMKDRKGYGMLIVAGRCILAHRFSYLVFRSDPLDQLVCHSCDNPRCVNPRHLWLGSVADNNLDCRLKGRARNGYPINDDGLCSRCGHHRTDDYLENRPKGRVIQRCRNCIRIRDAKVIAARSAARKAARRLAA